MKRLSIIILTYNSEKDIYDCVASIQKYSDVALAELELIVVDNNSRDVDIMFARLREQYGDDIILIKNTHNGGYGQGNNVGIRQATAPVLLIMNPDVRLIEPIFKTALDAFDKAPDLSVYGMKQMLSPVLPSLNSFSCTYMMNGYIYTLLTGLCTRHDWYLSRYMYFSGACFYIRKTVFEEIGLFDEDVFMYGEEDDIHYRIMQRKRCLMQYNPKLHYIHLVADRKPDILYEKKLLKAALFHARKKGYPVRKMMKDRLRNTTLLWMRELIRVKMKKRDLSLYNMLVEYRAYLKNCLDKHIYDVE